MNLYDLFEELSLDNIQLTETETQQLLSCYTNNQLIKAINIFLTGIEKQHQVPGDVINTLCGICDFYREHQLLTKKQKHYVFGRILANWDQLNLETRIELNL